MQVGAGVRHARGPPEPHALAYIWCRGLVAPPSVAGDVCCTLGLLCTFFQGLKSTGNKQREAAAATCLPLALRCWICEWLVPHERIITDINFLSCLMLCSAQLSRSLQSRQAAKLPARMPRDMTEGQVRGYHCHGPGWSLAVVMELGGQRSGPT